MSILKLKERHPVSISKPPPMEVVIVMTLEIIPLILLGRIIMYNNNKHCQLSGITPELLKQETLHLGIREEDSELEYLQAFVNLAKQY